MLIDYQQLPQSVIGIFQTLATPPIEAVWDALPARQRAKALQLARVTENWAAYDQPYAFLTNEQQEKVLTGMSLVYFKLKCENLAKSRKAVA